MKKTLWPLLVVLALVPSHAFSDDRPLLVVSEAIEIKAPPGDVWNVVKRFDGLSTWHPAFAKSPIVKGQDGQLGAVRELTVKDGPTFTEELLAINPQGMALTYNIIESPLPITDYLSTMSVKANSGGGATVTWVGTFRRKNPRASVPEGESDGGTVKFITGAYQAGLQNLKKILEK